MLKPLGGIERPGLKQASTSIYLWIYVLSMKHEGNICESHRNTNAFKSVWSHFGPESHLRDIRFR